MSKQVKTRNKEEPESKAQKLHQHVFVIVVVRIQDGDARAIVKLINYFDSFIGLFKDVMFAVSVWYQVARYCLAVGTLRDLC